MPFCVVLPPIALFPSIHYWNLFLSLSRHQISMPAKSKYPPARPEPESDSDETIEDEEEEEIDPIEVINDMPVLQRRKIYALKGLQAEFRTLHAQFIAEMAAAELAFFDKTAVLREERRKVVSGERDVTAEEMKAYQDVKQESGVEEIPSDDEGEQKKQKKAVTIVSTGDEKNKSALEAAAEKADGGIPGFWYTVLRHNEVTDGMVTERDAACLQSLTDITKEYIDGNPRKGFSLNFYFAENEYFTNKVLSKKYNFDQDPEALEEEEPLLDTIDGCEIDWKSQEKKLTVILKQKKQRHKGGKGVRVVTREEKCASFFHFFEAPVPPTSDDDEDEEEDDMDYNEQMEMDYEAATMFADHIIPRAVHYFSGRSIEEIASAMDFGGLMGGMGDDEEHEEEDESEEEEEVPAKGKKGAKGGKAAQPECKQQ